MPNFNVTVNLYIDLRRSILASISNIDKRPNYNMSRNGIYGTNKLKTYNSNTCSCDTLEFIPLSDLMVVCYSIAKLSLEKEGSHYSTSVIGGLCSCSFINCNVRLIFFHLFLFLIVRDKNSAISDVILELQSLQCTSSAALKIIQHKTFCIVVIYTLGFFVPVVKDSIVHNAEK